MNVDLEFLRRFARALQDALYSHPAAARKRRARPQRDGSGESRASPKHREKLACSFCCKGQREVGKLIAGPSVYICDECVALCAEILGEERAGSDRRAGRR